MYQMDRQIYITSNIAIYIVIPDRLTWSSQREIINVTCGETLQIILITFTKYKYIASD